MAQVCRHCSHVNPNGAAFCYYDGVHLGANNQGGPIDAGAKLFPTPFVFPSGHECRNFDQLARTCDSNWAEARAMLESGFFVNFLSGLGRADLALAARQAGNEVDKDRGLDQLLAKLPVNNREKATLTVQPNDMNLGPVTSDRSFLLRIRNDGAGLLTGTVASTDANWLAFGDAPGVPQKLFQDPSGTDLTVHVIARNLRASAKPIEGHIVVESNGGSAIITVQAEKQVRPFPDGLFAGALLPRDIAGRARSNPKGAAPLFESGAVKAWYESNGWTYPVQGPASSGLAAIQQFFEALGLVPAPVVTISQSRIQFQGNPGEARDMVLQVTTAEKRPVFAYGTTSAPWLQVGQAVLDGRTASIPVRVPAIPAAPGQRLQATIHVASNGQQRFNVEVDLQVLGRPVAVPVPAMPAPVAAQARPAVAAVTTAPAPQAWPGSAPVAVAVLAPPAAIATAAMPAGPYANMQPQAIATAPQSNGSRPPPPAAPQRPARGILRSFHVLPLLLLFGLMSFTFGRDGFLWMKGAPSAPEDDVEPPPLIVEAPEDPKPVDHMRVEVDFHDKELEMFFAQGGSLKAPRSEINRNVTSGVINQIKEGSFTLRCDRGVNEGKVFTFTVLPNTVDIPKVGTSVVVDSFVDEDRNVVLLISTRAINEPTMRFGIVMVADENGKKLEKPKLLTRSEKGRTNNTIVRIDKDDCIFGDKSWRLLDKTYYPLKWDKGNGGWRKLDDPLGNDENNQPRIGRKSIWAYPDFHVSVTQIVEVIRGPQSGMHDTVLVRYILTNEGTRTRSLGLRFLLDTFIGENDGVPFLIPTEKNPEFCNTSKVFDDPKTMPSYIEAQEDKELNKPDQTIARVELKVDGLEPPSRVTLGAWPNVALGRDKDPMLAARYKGARQEKTMWEVPVAPINTILDPDTNQGDSAVVLYWDAVDVGPGKSRQVGFAYGLGQVSSSQGKGKLAVSFPSSYIPPSGEFNLTALVSDPKPGQTVTLTVPDGFTLLDGAAKREVPKAGDGANNTSPVVWKVRAPGKAGWYRLKVESSNGASQSQGVRITEVKQQQGLFGN